MIVLRHIVSSPYPVISVVASVFFPELVGIIAARRPKIIISLVVEFIRLKRRVLRRRSSEKGFSWVVLTVIVTLSHVETVLKVGAEIGQKGWIAADEGGELSFIHNSKVW